MIRLTKQILIFNMATVTKNELMVGISTGGGNPGYAKKVKREVSQLVANLETEEIGRRNKKIKPANFSRFLFYYIALF